ncbi:type II 3-dehydroquinate dehydratase [Candidatus Vidania fulgoroideorum]
MKKIKIINGPNLNLLGIREKKIYGKKNFKSIKKIIKKNKNLFFFQSNNEYKIIKEIHNSYKKINYFIINPAGLSYNSFSLLDSLISVKIPYVEVHISNIFKRKGRNNTIFSKNSLGLISGFGIKSYIYALNFLLN